MSKLISPSFIEDQLLLCGTVLDSFTYIEKNHRSNDDRIFDTQAFAGEVELVRSSDDFDRDGKRVDSDSCQCAMILDARSKGNNALRFEQLSFWCIPLVPAVMMLISVVGIARASSGPAASRHQNANVAAPQIQLN